MIALAVLGASACAPLAPAVPASTPAAASVERAADVAVEPTTDAVAAPTPEAAPEDTAEVAPEPTTPPDVEPTEDVLTAPTLVPVPTLGVGPDVQRLPNPNIVAVPPPGSCQIVNGLPDHVCTPGLLNPRLTPTQLCARGFSTRAIRPPTTYTDVLKRRLMAAYGQAGPNPLTGRPWSPNDVELDHVVSLEDLGHPWSPLNLWPQPRRSTGAEPNAEEKDQVEVTVHELICTDQANAATYAARLADDWTQFRRARPPARAPKESEP
jgi:hypothetical protein